MFNPNASYDWDEKKNEFERKNKPNGIVVQYTYLTILPDIEHVPYIQCTVPLRRKEGGEGGKTKKISLVYFHASFQNLFTSFAWMIDLLGEIEKKLPLDVSPNDNIDFHLICFEYPFYFNGDVKRCNKEVLLSWDRAINYQLKCIFDIKLPGETGTFESFQAYEKETGNMIVYIGASVGTGFLCRQLPLGFASHIILLAPFTSVKGIALKESKKICFGDTAMSLLWSDDKHEYFPSEYYLETYIEGEKKVEIFCSQQDELCGWCVKDLWIIRRPRQDNIFITELDLRHEEFGGRMVGSLVASKIINFIQTKENEENQKELERTVRRRDADSQSSGNSKSSFSDTADV